MATHQDINTNVESDMKTQMTEFPHFTDLNVPGLTQERLRALLENLEEESDSEDLCENETISKLNFKSWVHTKLENFSTAEEINNDVITRTNWQNVMSVGNHVFLSWRAGKEQEALNCVSKLQEMKRRPHFDERKALAKAELAYSYSRVGGPQNLLQTINLLEEFVRQYPGNYFWKLRLGLAYRRSTHPNMYVEMSDLLTMQECFHKAFVLLTDVIDNSRNNKLRGPACSELAFLCKDAKINFTEDKYQRYFHNELPADIGKKALQYDPRSTWVMTNCGKVCWPQDAVPILQECLRARKHTTTHHQLGICYKKVAEYESKPSQRSGIGRGATSQVKKCTSVGDNRPQIHLPNENYNRAEQEFLEAIRMSHNQNVPAIYDLGLLYLSVGKEDKALEMFNRITNTGGKQHLMTIIRAYEQAGLIYSKKEKSKTLAEHKLTQAISLAFNSASSCLQQQNFASQMWHAFRTMADSVNEGQAPAKDPRLTRLYKLVKKHHKVVKVVEKLLALSDSKLKDPEVIKKGLKGCLNLNDTEKALTFLNIVSSLPDNINSDLWKTTEMKELMFKVLLRAAENRLKCQSQEARFVFQELFKLQFDDCAGDGSDDTVPLTNIRDVLFLYDEEANTEEGLNQTSMTIQALQDISSQVFGLNTSENLQGCVEYGNLLEIQLEEMKKCQVLVVVLGKEERSQPFEALLKMLSSLEGMKPSPKTVLVIDTACDSSHVPDILRQYRCYTTLKDAGSLAHRLGAGAACAGDQSGDQNVGRGFQGDTLDEAMQLFCFIIQQVWPCHSV